MNKILVDRMVRVATRARAVSRETLLDSKFQPFPVYGINYYLPSNVNIVTDNVTEAYKEST